MFIGKGQRNNRNFIGGEEEVGGVEKRMDRYWKRTLGPTRANKKKDRRNYQTKGKLMNCFDFQKLTKNNITKI